MTDLRQAAQQALEALQLPSLKTQAMLMQRDEAITALKATLEQPEQRKPLTDEQIDAEHDKLFPAPVIPGDRAKVRAFARAIAAHGIKEGT